MPLELTIPLAAIAVLLTAVWRPVVLPRYQAGAQPPLWLSWCTAEGRRVGLQLLVPVWWRRGLWCLRASAAAGPDGLTFRLHLWHRSRR